MKHLLSALAVLLALVAIALSWTARPTQRSVDAAGGDVDLGPLLARIEALERRLGEVEQDRRQSVLAPPSGSVVERVGAPGDTELLARLARLEEALAELATRHAAARESAPQPRAEPARNSAVELAELHQRARDASRSEAERLQALRALRGQREPNGVDARLAVLDDMIRLAQASTDAATRADVWRQLSNVTDARLKQPLLDALAFDGNTKVREEAAETLADFLPDGQVASALHNAAENDSDPGVRRQAASSLLGGR